MHEVWGHNNFPMNNTSMLCVYMIWGHNELLMQHWALGGSSLWLQLLPYWSTSHIQTHSTAATQGKMLPNSLCYCYDRDIGLSVVFLVAAVAGMWLLLVSSGSRAQHHSVWCACHKVTTLTDYICCKFILEIVIYRTSCILAQTLTFLWSGDITNGCCSCYYMDRGTATTAAAVRAIVASDKTHNII